MYDQGLVKRRRRRKIAAFIALVSGIGVTALVIVSFLGQYTGTFTVSLKNSSVRLSLSEKESFDDPTTYLRIDKLDPFEEYTYRNVLVADLDDEEKPYNWSQLIEKEPPEVLSYFKYTFYLKNMGGKKAHYSMAINLLECTESTDGTKTTLDDTLRVMVFENDLDDTYEKVYHDTVVYAKESATANTNIEGKKTKREFISTPAFQEDEDHPLATSFESLKTIATYDRGGFDLGQVRRYTLVTWLEGEDPDSPNDRAAPVGATLRLGVEITAYENENE